MKRALLLFLVLALLSFSIPAGAQTDDEITNGILDCFGQLAAIPRPSHHEEKIGAFLYEWAQARGYDVRKDAVGNILFDVPATEGFENAPVVALQAHMDMVAVSTDPNFDPLNTPIKLIHDGNTLTADGTSLGADNGIGIAAIMYLVDSGREHGPLRVIFTVNEEDGMTGVFGLDASVVADVSYLLNLDAETIGEAVVSTAAGLRLGVTQQPLRVEPTFDTAISIELSGLLGGHSGIMIGNGRINAVTNLADLLLFLRQSGVAYELASFDGGVAANAIPASAKAVILVGAQDEPLVADIVRERAAALALAYSLSDAGVTATVQRAELPETVFEAEQAEHIIDFAALVLDGLHTMSQAIDGLVESSSNLGVFHANADQVSAMLYARSSQAALLDSIGLKQTRLAESCGYEATPNYTADAWPVEVDSKLHALAQEVYLEQTGQELKLICLHAGLECGTFARMNPALELISIGPELHNPHSPDETLYLDSLPPFFRLVEGLLLRLGAEIIP